MGGGVAVAYEILVSSPGPFWVLVLGLRVWGQGLTKIRLSHINSINCKTKLQAGEEKWDTPSHKTDRKLLVIVRQNNMKALITLPEASKLTIIMMSL